MHPGAKSLVEWRAWNHRTQRRLAWLAGLAVVVLAGFLGAMFAAHGGVRAPLGNAAAMATFVGSFAFLFALPAVQWLGPRCPACRQVGIERLAMLTGGCRKCKAQIVTDWDNAPADRTIPRAQLARGARRARRALPAVIAGFCLMPLALAWACWEMLRTGHDLAPWSKNVLMASLALGYFTLPLVALLDWLFPAARCPQCRARIAAVAGGHSVFACRRCQNCAAVILEEPAEESDPRMPTAEEYRHRSASASLRSNVGALGILVVGVGSFFLRFGPMRPHDRNTLKAAQAQDVLAAATATTVIVGIAVVAWMAWCARDPRLRCVHCRYRGLDPQRRVCLSCGRIALRPAAGS